MGMSIGAGRLAKVTLFVSLAGACAGVSLAEGVAYRRLRLPNGLTVLVHEDHKAPIVSVGVWYGSGSADDPAGQSGLAHLSEHLMFPGSENHRAPHLDAILESGGTMVNATTDVDETAYYQTVPTGALDKALWLESDRMGHLLGALDEARLRTQRDIVLNERRGMLDRPHGRSQARLLRHVFPANHPYHRDGYGLPGDLENVSLDRARTWFRAHYGAANATLVMAGDITPEVAREKAMAYFADIAPGPGRVRQQPWVVPFAAPSRAVMHGKVAHTRIVKAWPVPGTGAGSAALVPLQLAATLLGGTRSSRLHRRLVTRDGLASGVEVTLSRRALAGMFVVAVDVAEHVDPAVVEAALDSELAAFIADGPAGDELALARTREEVGFLASTETMSGMARALVQGQLRHGDPESEWTFRERMNVTTAADVREAAASWLGRPGHTLLVRPAPDGFDAEAEDASDAGRGPVGGQPPARSDARSDFTVTRGWSVDRTRVPAVSVAMPKLPVPPLERARLGNGTELVLARRAGGAFTHVLFQFDRGSGSGNPADAARFMMAMLRQGTPDIGASEFARRIDRLGATLGSDCDADTCTLDLAVPRGRLASALAVMADATRRAAFRSADVERIRAQLMAFADDRQADAYEVAMATLARLRTDEGRPPASIETMDANDLRAIRDAMLRPDNLRVIVVGDVSREAALATLNTALGDWRAPDTPLPSPPAEAASVAPDEVAYLVHRPHARQSQIALGLIAPPATNGVALELANMVFAGGPGSRLDTNLREAKGWTYGVHSSLSRQRGRRPLTIDMRVQTDRTGAAIAELRREIAGLVEERSPLSDIEVGRHAIGLARSLAGALERGESVMHQIAGDVTLGRRDDFLRTLPETLSQTTTQDAGKALKDVLQTSRKTWVIVGDRTHIEGPLRAQFPGLRLVDGDGRVID